MLRVRFLMKAMVLTGAVVLPAAVVLAATVVLPAAGGSPGTVGGAAGNELVDINRASVAELMLAPGMTASWASRIVRFRPYRTKLDLEKLGVVTPDVYRRIRGGIIAHRVDGMIKPHAPLDTSGQDSY